MRFVLNLILGLGLAPALAHGVTMICFDNDHTVDLSVKLNKNRGEPRDIRLRSGEKARQVNREDVKRVRSNASDFFMVFHVQTKNGREELELDTHFKKGEHKASAGFLTNKTEKSERLPVTCNFT